MWIKALGDTQSKRIEKKDCEVRRTWGVVWLLFIYRVSYLTKSLQLHP